MLNEKIPRGIYLMIIKCEKCGENSEGIHYTFCYGISKHHSSTFSYMTTSQYEYLGNAECNICNQCVVNYAKSREESSGIKILVGIALISLAIVLGFNYGGDIGRGIGLFVVLFGLGLFTAGSESNDCPTKYTGRQYAIELKESEIIEQVSKIRRGALAKDITGYQPEQCNETFGHTHKPEGDHTLIKLVR